MTTTEAETQPVRVVIDLNIRTGTGGQLTYAGFEDVRGGPLPERGTSVLAFESESRIEAPAIVVDLDVNREIIYLAVAWQEFQDSPADAPLD